MAEKKEELYGEAKSVMGGWKGHVYKYDETGNRTITVKLFELRDSKNEAIDDIAEWEEAGNGEIASIDY